MHNTIHPAHRPRAYRGLDPIAPADDRASPERAVSGVRRDIHKESMAEAAEPNKRDIGGARKIRVTLGRRTMLPQPERRWDLRTTAAAIPRSRNRPTKSPV